MTSEKESEEKKERVKESLALPVFFLVYGVWILHVSTTFSGKGKVAMASFPFAN
jgi:hypothetical protein